MTEIISTTYTMEHCTCYELYNGDTLLGVRIVLDSGYVFKRTFEDNGETIIAYISGFVTLHISVIDEMWDEFEVIPIEDVPEGEYISGITDPEETI